ncbi:MAG: DUF4013 domain-containing protein [Bacteroidota bacterium]
MDFGNSFSYVFRDEDWLKKIFVGGLFILLSILIIGFFFIVGYQLEIMRRVMRREAKPLADWDDLGRKLGEGFMLAVAVLVYAVPIMIVGSFLDGEAGLLVGLMVLAFLIWIPAVQIQYARTSDFTACFRAGEIFEFVRKNLGTYLPAVLLSTLVCGLVFGFGWIVLFVGWPWMIFWGYAVSSHILGQVGTLWTTPSPEAVTSQSASEG